MSYFIRKAKDIFFKKHPGTRFPAIEEKTNEILELVEIYFETRINKKPNFHKKENHNHHKRLHLVKR